LKQPPLQRNEPVLSRFLWERVAVAGVIAAVATLALFRWELDHSGSLQSARSVALTTLVAIESLQVFSIRSLRSPAFRVDPRTNPFLLLATAGGVVIHLVALYVPPIQYLLRLEPVSLDAWLRILVVAFVVLLAVEMHNYLRREQHRVPTAGSAGERRVGKS